MNLPSGRYYQIWPQALSYLHEFREVIIIEQPLSSPSVTVKWKPPDQTWYKINYDGAPFPESNEGGIRVAIRDQISNVITILSQKINTSYSVEMVVAFATRRAIFFALEVGIYDVEIEGDSTIIVQALNGTDTSHLAYGHVIDDTLTFSPLFQRLFFSHTQRSGNSVGHALARRAKKFCDNSVWMEEVPLDIVHVSLKDSLSFY